MSANNTLALELYFSGALVSVGTYGEYVHVDPTCTMSARVPVVSPKWTVETQSDGTERLVQRWAVMRK